MYAPLTRRGKAVLRRHQRRLRQRPWEVEQIRVGHVEFSYGVGASWQVPQAHILRRRWSFVVYDARCVAAHTGRGRHDLDDKVPRQHDNFQLYAPPSARSAHPAGYGSVC